MAEVDVDTAVAVKKEMKREVIEEEMTEVKEKASVAQKTRDIAAETQ